MKFLSVCSGIEAASSAWRPLGWEAVAFSEIEPFPCAVLAHHYPDTPNWGDMTQYKEWPDVSIDLLCGGTPCQSFSVAGLRKGLDDPRGNLMLTFGAIAAKYRPKWLVWENVPGVLSSNGGADFGAFLGMLGQLGYGFAYRVLDAQYFGVAQRRRRVFVVGCLGDWRSAAAVLFEHHSLQGHPAPSRKAGQIPAPCVTAGAANGGAAHGARSGSAKDGLIVPVEQPYEVANCLTARMHKGINSTLDEGQTPVVRHSLRGEGFDASGDGTGRGTPLVPVAFAENSRHELRLEGGDGQRTGALSTGGGKPGQGVPMIAFPANLSGTQCASAVDVAPSMGALNPTAIAIQGTLLGRSDTAGPAGPAGSGINEDGISFTQTKTDVHAVAYGMAVRRLTPTECERLQGFPDDYTQVPHRNKPAADGPRYKALGNSWAVPVAHWIGRRIDAVEAIHAQKAREAA